MNIDKRESREWIRMRRETKRRRDKETKCAERIFPLRLFFSSSLRLFPPLYSRPFASFVALFFFLSSLSVLIRVHLWFQSFTAEPSPHRHWSRRSGGCGGR